MALKFILSRTIVTVTHPMIYATKREVQQSSMRSNYRVRRATVNDLPHILNFIAQEALESEGREADLTKLEIGIATALRDESIAIYWVLVDQANQPVGCTSVVKEWSDWNAGYYWWIQSLFIDPAHRGQGLLNVMMDAVETDSRADSCLEIRLYVHRNNAAAIRAYEKAQFTPSDYQIMARKL